MNTDKHGSEIEQLRKENQRLQQDRDAAIRQLADEGRTRGAVELERDRLRDENRRLRDAAITVMDRVGRAGVQGWSMQQFLEDGSVAELVDALAQPAPAPAQQPEPAKDRLREMTDEEADALIERVEDAVGMGKGAWDMTPGRELARSFAAAIAASKGEVHHG